VRPKPLVEIGGRPVLWHIMKLYSAYGLNEFIICCGYKGYLIKEYFANYSLHMSDVTIDMRANSTVVHQRHAEPWSVTLVDTGEETATGGRLRRIRAYLNEEDFCMTYGDAVGDVDISALIRFARKSGTPATVTTAHPPGRFGVLTVNHDKITSFREKPPDESGWVSCGYFVLSAKVIDYIPNDNTSWEREPLERLARENNLAAYVHPGYWQPLDTLRDKILLNQLWDSGKAPWKVWH